MKRQTFFGTKALDEIAEFLVGIVLKGPKDNHLNTRLLQSSGRNRGRGRTLTLKTHHFLKRKIDMPKTTKP
ncbi:hypothetical protein, partial [Vibrio sp. TRT 17S01]|uniref:hypothetical protein n=1 Tax=Vibrio sp. TRT 17S01 TaxID=3418505 RepID=UPI003CF95E85